MSPPLSPPPRWPLWILGFTLLALLWLAYRYGLDPAWLA
ncbi:hypothetical protein GFS31_09400 [Leptolyngbya sp. BL0902]|nr:hypothetical protein GFS31_09400 [Leptolyngbya sp. BL0902]